MSDSGSLQNNDTSNEKWYASWFDTPYYHILYKKRDTAEAEAFIDTITHYLNLPENAKVLDLACGKGRHARYLNKLGYKVTGADLSVNNIHSAQKKASETLQFIVHDMRNELNEKYDAIFNFFTSFGYFDNEADDLQTLLSIKKNLTDEGFAVIDFMNVNYVLRNLITSETKTVNDIEFRIKRYSIDGYIYKEIDFETEGKQFHFIEKVRAFTLNDFERMMEQVGIFLLDIFGDYKLNKFNKNESERLIMVFK
jgi:SAM-dependent methyltransferase